MPFNQAPLTEDAPFVDGNVITGRVVEVQNQSVFQTPAGKAVGFLFGGQPYQFSRQALKSTIFVEPVDAFEDSNGVGRQRALVFHGDINGAIAKGNLVQATVMQRGGALYVKQLNNLTTSSRISATPQVGGPLAALLIASAICLTLALVFILARAVADGSLGAAITGAILAALAPVIGVLGPYMLIIIGLCCVYRFLLR